MIESVLDSLCCGLVQDTTNTKSAFGESALACPIYTELVYLSVHVNHQNIVAGPSRVCSAQ